MPVVRSDDGHTSAKYGPTIAKPPSTKKLVAININQNRDVVPKKILRERAAQTIKIAEPKPKTPPEALRPIASERNDITIRPNKPARLTKIIRNAALAGVTAKSWTSNVGA